MASRYQITRRLEFDAAHRVLRHESKCSTLHGHRYTAHITVSAAELDGVGRVIDFGAIKGLVGSWIDERWDHTTIINEEDGRLLRFCKEEADHQGKKQPYVMRGEPTAENMAKELFEIAQLLLQPEGIQVDRVVLHETPNCSAEWAQ